MHWVKLLDIVFPSGFHGSRAKKGPLASLTRQIRELPFDCRVRLLGVWRARTASENTYARSLIRRARLPAASHARQGKSRHHRHPGGIAAGLAALSGVGIAAAGAASPWERPRPPGRYSKSDADSGDASGAQIMGSTTDKTAGIANEAIGKAKQGIGKAVGSDNLQVEGASQELKGNVQKVTGDAKATIKDAANKTARAANENL
jgi:uncharacterized protein YjbJ (UPF0337 family)